MLSIGTVAAPGQAARYFDKDDYYTRDAESPSAWLGTGATTLGLNGGVDKAAFEALLEGRVPATERRLGYEKDGVWKHIPGWDLTFSAPKSVSILAEVIGDRRLVAAHDAAVAAAIAKVERALATTRYNSKDGLRFEKTGNLVVASFRHDLSRNQDPQLHTHAVVVNMTESPRGWRSLASRTFFENSKSIGVLYQQELAMAVRRLGYETIPGRNGTFEIRGVSEETLRGFSSRRSEIEAKLRHFGVDPTSAGQDVATRAALATRAKKSTISREEAVAIWDRALSTEARQSLEVVREEAEQRAALAPAGVSDDAERRAADRVLLTAVETLSERDAAFSTERLMATANALAVGRTRERFLDAALERALQKGDLVGRQVREADAKARADVDRAGVATARAQAAERRLIEREHAGRNAMTRVAGPRHAKEILKAAEARSAAAGHIWTEDQRRATLGLLGSRHRVHAVQGLAGTAKTTTVLATYAAAAERSGRRIVALAPTASAAETLGRALGKHGITVARHLSSMRAERAGGVRELSRSLDVWIVDEASMLATCDLSRLLKAAEMHGARLVLVGDAHQLGSVGAGRGFDQLQRAGMVTERLEEIVRQSNPAMKDAVEAALKAEAKAALGKLEAAGGVVVEAAEAQDRFAAVARHWLALSPAERAETIVIDPSREGRESVNAAIREGLLRDGTLGSTTLEGMRLEKESLTAAEARQAQNYAKGDVVLIRRDLRFGKEIWQKGTYAAVLSANRGENRLRLRLPSGRAVYWNPVEEGASKAELFKPQEADLGVGDRIVWTRNDRARGLANGRVGIVREIDGATRTATVRFDARAVALSMSAPADRHWRHAYAETAYAAQGRTAERVIVHAESHRIHLVNLAAFYVALSRARETGVVVTDDRDKLAAGIARRAGRKETALALRDMDRAAERPAPGVSFGTRARELTSETIAEITRAARAGARSLTRADTAKEISARRHAFEVARDRADAQWRRMSSDARREAERDPFSIHWRPPEQRLDAHAAQDRREPTVTVERPKDDRVRNRDDDRQQPARSVEVLFRRDAADKAREAKAPAPSQKPDRGIER
ncbi:MAG: MobF family relaxase [Pseudomonadota bacterium]